MARAPSPNEQESFGPKLAATIVHCTGEDESFPVKELARRTSVTRGWQTPKLCEWPQELIFRFEGEVELTAIRILSHESKIASRIEVFVAEPSDADRRARAFPDLDTSVGSSVFRRLGYMAFSSNEASGHSARELKTVHVRTRCCFVKLSVKRCHPNGVNPFNQVGIIAVAMHGSVVDRYAAPSPSLAAPALSGGGDAIAPVEIAGDDRPSAAGNSGDDGRSDVPLHLLTPQRAPPAPAYNSNAYDAAPASTAPSGAAEPEPVLMPDGTPYDAITADKIRELTLHKARAVDEEDYDRAKVLKKQIDDLRSAGVQIASLEATKRQAVADEDYDTAKMLKFRIEGLRQAALAPPRAEDYQPQPQPASQHSHFSQPYQHQPPPQRGATAAAAAAAPTSFDEQPAGVRSRRAGQPDEAPATLEQLGSDAPPEAAPPAAVRAKRPAKPAAAPGPVENYDERPAVAGGGAGGGGGGDDTGGIVVIAPKQSTKPGAAIDAESMAPWEKQLNAVINRLAPSDAGPAEALAAAKLAECKDFTFAFGSYATSCLFSKRWQLREAALRAVSSKEGFAAVVSKGPNSALGAVVALLQYLGTKNHGVEDPISNVFFTGCDALKKIVYEELSDRASVASVATHIAPLLAELMLRAGDNNQRVREQASTVLMLTAMSAFGAERVSHAALTEPETVGKKPLAHRVQLARCHITGVLLEKCGLNRKDQRSGLTVDGVMSRLALPLLAHPSNEVREAAIAVIVALHRLSTPAIMEKFLSGIKPAQRAVIDEQLSGGAQGGGGGGGGAEMASSSLSVANDQKGTHPVVAAARAAAAGGGGGGGGGAPAAAAPAKAPGKKTTPPAPAKTAAETAKQQRDEAKRCQFCGKYDERYTDETLDLHYVRNCPCLCPCPLCGQVTEIALLQEHLVKECDRKSMVRMCTLCHEAVRTEDLDAHMVAATCIPHNPKQYSVCPLCHAKLAPGDKGWDEHLLKAPGCRNNPRRYDGGNGEEFQP